jgi:hypothetical protein
LPQSRFELQHAGSPSEKAALEEKGQTSFFGRPVAEGDGSWDSSKAFSKPTAMQGMTKSVGREWYMPLVGLMQEGSFSKQYS